MREDSHQLVAYSSCGIQDPIAEKIIATLCELMTKLRMNHMMKISEPAWSGIALIRIGHVSREVLVLFRLRFADVSCP